ncbi:hypothetical protein [Alteribacter aurantiacus]|uniref:hypothetical protein n=1 Tax=Alteribacter aurantiacus TaxID=254410 RepID=UPI00040460B8|nr:hypothetical protein [Alteribacter aurantiacus]
MAQLVKLTNCISRYESDVYRYSSRFNRLKTDRWDRLKMDWGKRKHERKIYEYEEIVNSSFGIEGEDRAVWKKWIPFLKKKQEGSIAPKEDESFFPHLRKPISSIEALKKAYLEELYSFQLTWATSTIHEKSYLNRDLKYDPFLAMLVKSLPDTYMLFYKPVIAIRRAEVEMEVMIVTPTEMWLIHCLGGDDHTIYKPFNDRYWTKDRKPSEERIVHPHIPIKRMKSVIYEVFQKEGMTYPIKTAVVAKDSYIDMPRVDTKVSMIDKRTFPGWYEKLKRHKSPIKHQQLKVTEVLLNHCTTESHPREQSDDQKLS